MRRRASALADRPQRSGEHAHPEGYHGQRTGCKKGPTRNEAGASPQKKVCSVFIGTEKRAATKKQRALDGEVGKRREREKKKALPAACACSGRRGWTTADPPAKAERRAEARPPLQSTRKTRGDARFCRRGGNMGNFAGVRGGSLPALHVSTPSGGARGGSPAPARCPWAGGCRTGCGTRRCCRPP